MPKAAIDIRDQSDHSASQRPEIVGRKLDLVKCNRCRLDKQKCTPTTRTWPIKCDRCLKKGFPCSKGRRIERKSKHIPNHSGSTSNKFDHEDCLDNWIFLRSFYEIVSKSLERFSRLREAMVQPFIETGRLKRSLYERVILAKEEIVNFLQELEDYIEDLRVLISASLASGNAHTPVKTLLAGQRLLPVFAFGICPYCEDITIADEVLDDLQDHNLLCTEFQVRQSRLASALSSNCHLIDHDEEMAAEIDRSVTLRSLIIDRLEQTDFKAPYGYNTLWKTSVVISDEVSFFRFSAARSEGEDLLGRTIAHRWLDAMPLVPHREQYLGHLKSYLGKAEDLDHQDELGRTLLHIACIEEWQAGVEMLLQYGANPGLPTIDGSLPLHYAAANGSVILCGLLLERTERFNVNKLDKAGLKAQDYAFYNGNLVIVEMLRRSTLEKSLPSVTPAIQNANLSAGASDQSSQPYLNVFYSKPSHVRDVSCVQQHNNNVLSATSSATLQPLTDKAVAGPDAVERSSHLHPYSSMDVEPSTSRFFSGIDTDWPWPDLTDKRL